MHDHLNYTTAEKNNRKLKVKQQQGSNDCGCFAIVNCYLLCKGEDPAISTDQNKASYETSSSPALRNDSLAFSLQKLSLVQLGLTFSTYKLPVSPCTYTGLLLLLLKKECTPTLNVVSII